MAGMGNPTIDGATATFAWAGEGPPPTVVGSWCEWNPKRARRMHRAGIDTWRASVVLPRDAYVEYAYLRDGAAVSDPLNPATIDNGVGGRNHRFWMPDATRRAISLSRRRVPRGEVETDRLDLGYLAGPPARRRIATYLPRGARDDGSMRRELPLLVVLDGLDYLRRGRLARLLDALIAGGQMAPVAAVFVDDAGPARSAEYAANDFTAAVLADIVVRAAVRRLGLDEQHAAHGAGRAAILGSSFGGLMALHAGARRPDVFGTVIAQSTAPLLEPFPMPGGSVQVALTLLDLVGSAPFPPVRLWLDVGELEDLAPQNDRLVELLRGRGANLHYRRFPGGHDQTSWVESLVDALPAMLPVGG